MTTIPTQTLEGLRALPVPDFAERNTETLKRDLVAKFEAITKRTLYPAQPENYMIHLMAYALSNVGSAIQIATMQNRAVWADARHLDDVGGNVSTFRLLAQHARAEVEFTLTETRPSGVVVPKGTRVSAGGTLIFRTDEELVIAAGNLTGIVGATANEMGAAFNGLLPGQVKDILDPVAFVSSVKNTQVTAGGSDIEEDDRFRGRVVNALERISRGGPRQGYKELVKAAHPDIVDVEVIRPQPGYIHIFPLMNSGVAPDAIDDLITGQLDPDTMIPQGDFVSIHKAVSHVFNFTMLLRVLPGFLAEAEQQARAKIEARFAEWSQKLGVQIAPSALIEDVRQVPGVVGVEIPDLTFTDLPSTHFAKLGAFDINPVETPDV